MRNAARAARCSGPAPHHDHDLDLKAYSPPQLFFWGGGGRLLAYTVSRLCPCLPLLKHMIQLLM